MPPKRLLFILTAAPYTSARAVETIESILVAGVFEQEVSVLFKDMGIYQLLSGQDGAAVGQRTVGKMLQALPEYDVERLFVCKASMARLGVTQPDLCLPVKYLDHGEQRELIRRQDAVVSG